MVSVDFIYQGGARRDLFEMAELLKKGIIMKEEVEGRKEI